MNSPTLLCGDCLELMKRIPNGSIDMVLSDLPYGTTRCRWDTPINLQELWKQYRRVVKENGAIVLFSAQPFTTELISSNKAMYRYEWIWKKTQPSGFMNAKKMPLRSHENIEIFYRKPPTYNPQMTHGHQRKTATAYGTRESDGNSCYGREERNYTAPGTRPNACTRHRSPWICWNTWSRPTRTQERQSWTTAWELEAPALPA